MTEGMDTMTEHEPHLVDIEPMEVAVLRERVPLTGMTGFYDRAFAGLSSVRKFGLGWSVQQRPAIAHDAWDVPLDAIVTEAGVIGGKAAS